MNGPTRLMVKSRPRSRSLPRPTPSFSSLFPLLPQFPSTNFIRLARTGAILCLSRRRKGWRTHRPGREEAPSRKPGTCGPWAAEARQARELWVRCRCAGTPRAGIMPGRRDAGSFARGRKAKCEAPAFRDAPGLTNLRRRPVMPSVRDARNAPRPCGEPRAARTGDIFSRPGVRPAATRSCPAFLPRPRERDPGTLHRRRARSCLT